MPVYIEINTIQFLFIPQIILITDGNTGFGEGSLENLLRRHSQRSSTDGVFPLPYPFASKLHVVLIAPQNEPGTYSNM